MQKHATYSLNGRTDRWLAKTGPYASEDCGSATRGKEGEVLGELWLWVMLNYVCLSGQNGGDEWWVQLFNLLSEGLLKGHFYLLLACWIHEVELSQPNSDRGAASCYFNLIFQPKASMHTHEQKR